MHMHYGNTVCNNVRVGKVYKKKSLTNSKGNETIRHVARIEFQRALPHNYDRSMASHIGDICTNPSIHRQSRSYAVDTPKEVHQLSDKLVR